MSVGRLRQIGISIALGSCLGLGCGREKSEEPAEAKSEEPAAEAAALGWVVGSEGFPDFHALPTVELPGNFPEDVPLYPGARAVKAPPDAESANGWVGQFSTPDDPAKIYAKLADDFAAQGWSTQSGDGADAIMLFATKGDRSVTYALEPIKGKTVLSLIIVESP
jgi:hypothetical protein